MSSSRRARHRRQQKALRRHQLRIEGLEKRYALDGSSFVGPEGWGWIGVSANTQVKAVAEDSTGAVYLAGTFSGTVDVDFGATNYTLASNGLDDAFVAKYTEQGDFVWAKSFGSLGKDRGYTLAIASDDSIRLGGFFSETVDFDPGAGANFLTSAGAGDGFVLALDSAGNYQWAGQFGGTGTSWANGDGDFVNALVVDETGNTLVGGVIHYSATASFGGETAEVIGSGMQNSIIMKIDDEGVLQWTKHFNSSFLNGVGHIAVAPNNDVIVGGGLHTQTMDADPGPGFVGLTNAGLADAYIVALDSEGDYRWGYSYGSTAEESTGGVTTDSLGNVYMVAGLGGTQDLDPGVGEAPFTADGNQDLTVISFDTDGIFRWAETFGGTGSAGGHRLIFDGNGDLVVSGIYETSLAMPDGTTVSNLVSNGLFDNFVLWLDPQNGSPQRAINIGTSGNENQTGTIAQSGSNGLLIGGTLGSGGSFLVDPEGWDFLTDGGSVLTVPSGGGGYLTRLIGEPTNNPPSNITLTDAVNTILENADTSSAIRIAGIDVTDDELGSNVVNLSGPDASSFYYTAGFSGAFGGAFAQGGIYLNPGIALDAISKPSFQFTVEVSDTSLPGSDPVTVDHTLTVLAAEPTVAVTDGDGETSVAGDIIEFTATYAQAVTVLSSIEPLTITIDVGGTTRQAHYVSGSGTTDIVFNYTVQAGDLDTDGITLTSPIDLNGGAIQDAGGNAAVLTFTPPTLTGVLVDAIVPVATLITPPTGGSYFTASDLTFVVTFDSDVEVTGTPILPLTIGSTTRNASYADGSGTNTLTFRYTIQSADQDVDGITVDPASITGTITDTAGNAADFSSVPTPSTVAVIVNPVIINSVTPSANGDYKEGDTIELTANFTEAVSVTGTPRIELTLDSGTVFADYASGSGTTDIVFNYTVQSGDEDTDGITLTSPIDLNGGTIQDASLDDAELTFVPPTTPGIRIVEATNNPPSNVTLTDSVNSILETADTSSAIRIAGIDVTDDELGSNVVNLSGPDASSFYYTAGFGGAFGGGFAQGGIYLNPGIALDATSKPSFQFTVEVSDTSLPGSDPVTVDHTLTILNVNDLPTGSVTIAGTPREDEVLTASNTIADADGLGAISYQWKRDGVAINGATNSTYTLLQADVGSVITVTASYTDQGGTNESVTSAATATVVSGVSTFTHSFDLRSGPDTSPHQVSNAQIYREVFPPNCYYWAPSSLNQWSEVIYKFDLPLIVDTVDRLPAMDIYNANASVNFDNAAEGFLDVSADGVNWTTVYGSTSSQGVTQPNDPSTVLAGTDTIYLRARLFATRNFSVNNVEYAQFLRSRPEQGNFQTLEVSGSPIPSNSTPTGSVTIAGTAREDEVLTASNTLADADGLGAISYQWKRDGIAISGAMNSTYTLVQADVGSVITVTASYTDQGGTNESVTSTGTASVIASDNAVLSLDYLVLR